MSHYYLVESQQINGKPYLVKQKYLGRADQVATWLQAGPPTPRKPPWRRIEEHLRVVNHINAVAPKRNQGPSVGQYLLVTAMNRALAPTSKAQIADGYHLTPALYHHSVLMDLSKFDHC